MVRGCKDSQAGEGQEQNPEERLIEVFGAPCEAEVREAGVGP